MMGWGRSTSDACPLRREPLNQPAVDTLVYGDAVRLFGRVGGTSEDDTVRTV